MVKRRTMLALYCVLLTLNMVIVPAAVADTSENMPEPLKAAAAAYKSEGAGAFLPALLSGSSLPGIDETLYTGIKLMLLEIETHYGNYLGLELIGSIPVTASTRLVYYLMNYERGPLYGVVVVYASKYGEIITSTNMNTELDQVIPVGTIAAIR